jgi:hypothetical protein
MKDYPARSLTGIDVMPLAIELGKTTNPWCSLSGDSFSADTVCGQLVRSCISTPFFASVEKRVASG